MNERELKDDWREEVHFVFEGLISLRYITNDSSVASTTHTH